MARVSQAHLDARRRQILDGAARCFTRNGFHATSMQDVLREVDLSAGAVYRYFGSKEELIAAIAEEAFGSIRAAFETAAVESPPPPPDQLLARVLGQVLDAHSGLAEGDEPAFPRLIVQVWAETLRNEQLSALMRHGYASASASWVTIVEGYRDAGMMAADVPAEHVARTLIAVAQGIIAQQALLGSVSTEVL